MFNSISNHIKNKTVSALFTVLMLTILSSCMPEATSPSSKSSNSTTTTTNTNTNYNEPKYPVDGIFIQESSVQTTAQFTLPISFTDSFLIRGKSLSVYLRTLPTSTNFCLVGKFTYSSGQDKFLVLSAKPKTFTDLSAKTTEFYLQVEPSNDQANQNDCLTYNLTNTLYTNASSPSLSFSLQQVCSTCTTTAISTPLKLYFNNGEIVPTISVSSMTLAISGSSSNSGNACVDATACTARGFDCCLDSQCAKDGAVRPSAVLNAGFAAAQEDVRLNPDRFIVYPQFYYVCPSRPGNTTTGSGGGGGSTTDPEYEAAVRLMELTQLYSCLNKVNGEFSHCTLKFKEASKRIPGNFSGTDLSYNDDVNFGSMNPNIASTDTNNNIVKIVYAGQVLYEENKTAINGANFVASSFNDDLSRSQTVNVTSVLPTNAKDDNLYLTYKVDGSCEKVGTTLARCSKTYIQGSSDTLSPTWHDTSKVYYLPTYADVSASASIIVKISGIIVPEESTTWTRGTSNITYNGISQPKPRITFNSAYPIYQNQTIEISYFVNGGAASLVGMRSAAQATVNSMCTCSAASPCNLKPLYNTANSLVNYECIYPTPTANTPPANQTVFVSTRNVPHRYYDTSGVNYDENYDSAPTQELTAFAYTNDDVLRPNNVSSYIGFNEIYGSFAKSGSKVAYPAKLVKVKKDQQYDITVSSGVYSSCATCGNDYYTSLQKIFPQNFSGMAGGYSPDYYNSQRENSTGVYRADDLLYGRACFVPATMIPWTHFNSGTSTATPTSQRRARLAAQHFLFANGYNRDWFGFDYGSLIGSFDGVTWFSVGNQRRIKATSPKLYLAVNSYYGDLNVDSNFSVNVMESSVYSSTIPEHDTNSDGAQCQKAHYCSTDNDCARQLGFDYSCQNVTGLTTTWPQFDANGAEVVGALSKTVASLVSGVNGQAKRCVYRGRGAPCVNNLATVGATATYNGSTLIGTLACSPNNHCLPTSSNKFNDRIARFANTPLAQNIAAVASPLSDIVGLGARIIGRPFDYYGSKTTPAGALTSLNQNYVSAVCVPGKEISSSVSTFDLNSRSPSVRNDTSDKLFGVGATMSGTQNAKYLNACPATDTTGTSLHLSGVNLNDVTLSTHAITQNLSSNLLDLTPLKNQNIYSSTTSGTTTSQITAVGYQKNACLRAPGSTCFSDMECAPSTFIATRAKTSSFTGILNEAEEKYWEEELICGNPDFKKLDDGSYNPNFSIKKNTCCRDIGKVLSVYTQTDSSQHHWCDTASNTVKVAGVNTPISSINRYSRVHTGYDKMTCDRTAISSSKTFALSLAAPSSTARLTQILQQYKTLDAINQRTCCTQNWVRSFASENGGGHAFTRSKMQTVDKTMFKHVSWFTQNTTIITDSPFECHVGNYANASCEVRSLSPADEEKYLTWAGSLELLGIPQVAVKTNDEIFKLVDDAQIDNAATQEPLNNSIKDVDVVGEDFMESVAPNNRYFSAASYNKFNIGAGQLKKVFSENEFNCCVPSGQEVPTSVGASQCCTGYVANVGGPRRCCLPDFTNLTVYLNRYVSSEGRGLSESAYDPKTGFIKDAGQVATLANQKNLCCSGKMMTGVAISNLSIPIQGGVYLPKTPTSTSKRFNYRTDAVDNNEETGAIGSIFDAGLRWNNHVYCVPEDFGN